MPSIYKRSLLKVGNGALAIVIPRSWANYYGLKPKDVLQVRVNKNLTVYPNVIAKNSFEEVNQYVEKPNK